MFSNLLGRCLVSPGRCEIEGWCPVINDYEMPTSRPSLDTLNFTIFLKNFITFKYFGVGRSNIFLSPPDLRQCIYDPVYNDTCPRFRIGDLLNMIEPDEVERRLMLQYGAIIRINIDWSCNLDRSLRQCLPEYSFRRLDLPYEELFPRGFSFR